MKMFSLDSGQIHCACEVAALESPEHPAHLSNTSWDTRVTCQAPSPHFEGKKAVQLLRCSLMPRPARSHPYFWEVERTLNPA